MPVKQPSSSRDLALAVAALAVVAVVGGAFLLGFAYFAGTMAFIQGPVTSSTADEVCVQDPYLGQQCLARDAILLTDPSAAIPDPGSIAVGHCVSYVDPKRFQGAVDVQAGPSCDPPATVAPPTTPSTTR